MNECDNSIVAWQWWHGSGWTPCEAPDEKELLEMPEKFRPLFTRPAKAVDVEAASLARLRFFRDLIEAERVKVYKAFGILPSDYDGPLNLGIESKLFAALLRDDNAG